MNQAINMNNANVSCTNSSLSTLDNNQQTLNTKVNEMAATLHQLNAAMSRLGTMGNTMPTYPPVSYTLLLKYQPHQVMSLKYLLHHQLMFLKLVQLNVAAVDEDVVDEVEEVMQEEDIFHQYFHQMVMEVFHHQHNSINSLRM